MKLQLHLGWGFPTKKTPHRHGYRPTQHRFFLEIALPFWVSLHCVKLTVKTSHHLS